MPETHSPYSSLAIGHGGQPSTLGLVDEALATTEPPRAATQSKSKQRPAAQPVLAKQTAGAQQPAVSDPVPAPSVRVEQPEQLAINAPPTSAGDEQRYSQRETQSQKQRDFRGGDAVVISASALVIILLVVLLVLLLT